MTFLAPKLKTLGADELKAHWDEELKAVEEEGLTLHLTRQGKVVAVLTPPKEETPTLKEWIGSGAGLMSQEAIESFDDPTWTSQGWEEFSPDDPSRHR